MNLISSFGFSARWRRQCLDAVHLAPGMSVVDLMTGMGELLGGVDRRLEGRGRIVAIDLSPEMCRRAQESSGRCESVVTTCEADVLEYPFEEGFADAVVCSFGLKTLSPNQIERLAEKVSRLLKSGGTFAFLEISVPPSLGSAGHSCST